MTHDDTNYDCLQHSRELSTLCLRQLNLLGADEEMDPVDRWMSLLVSIIQGWLIAYDRTHTGVLERARP
jgi:hypothetical protein